MSIQEKTKGKGKYQVNPGNKKEVEKAKKETPTFSTKENSPLDRTLLHVQPAPSTKYWEQKTYKLPPEIAKKLKMASSILGVHERDLVLDAIKDKLALIGPQVQSKIQESMQEWN